MSSVAEVLNGVLKNKNFKASKEQWKVINAITKCRTAELGGHLYKCRDCSTELPCYNSCRNRHCPQCQGSSTAKWLEKRSLELLPVPYFHVVFTIPHEFNGIILQNKALTLNLLFKAVAKTLQEVGSRKYKGEIGFFSILHTWGQKLDFHPHIHCVIPGAVIKEDGRIKKTGKKFFLAQKVLVQVFRAIFIKLLKCNYKKLEFYGEQATLSKKTNFNNLCDTLKKKSWIVYAKKPFRTPETVFKYLSQYTHKIAISNSRIESYKNNKVSFSYKDYANNCKKKTLTLTDAEFVRRFLLHVVPRQFVRIRHFGFLANSHRTKKIKAIQKVFNEPCSFSLKAKELPECPKCKSNSFTYVKKLNPHKKKILPFVA